MERKTTKKENDNAGVAPFNILDIVGFGRREEEYTELLAWLLDHEGEHGLENAILQRIMTKIGLDFFDAEYEVKTEKNYEGRRLDISIRSAEWHIVFENKVHESALNDVKLREEYDKTKKSAEAEGNNFAFVFLYPRKLMHALDDHVIKIIAKDDVFALTWCDIAEILEEFKEKEKEGATTQVFLKHFYEHLRRLDMVIDGKEFEMSMKKHSLEIEKYMELYNNENRVKELMIRYLKYIVDGVFSDPRIPSNEFSKPKYGREKKLNNWTPYVRFVEFRLEKNTDISFWVGIYIDTDNENKWSQYIGGDLSNDVFKALNKDLKEIINSFRLEFEEETSSNTSSCDGFITFDPSHWEEQAALSVNILKAFIIRVLEYLGISKFNK